MGAGLRLIACTLQHALRYGVSTINRVVAWARAHWKRVQGWLERGVTFGTILHWILQSLGLA